MEVGYLWILVVLCLVSLFSSCHAAKSSKASKSTTTISSLHSQHVSQWEDIHLKDVPASTIDGISYLLEDQPSDVYKNVVKDLVYIIYRKQQLTTQQCKSNRLLVVQMSSTSFEGIGSLLKQIQFGVSVAMHSNRSMIWGFGFPFMFEHSKDVWDGPENDQISINGYSINCTQHDPLAGPIGCFFKPVSTCSLADVGPTEMLDFSNNAWNDSARIMIGEVRKGVSLYHPPLGLMDYIMNERGYSAEQRVEIKKREAFLWAGAVTAYVFRLKDHLVHSFRSKFNSLLPHKASGEIWGLHVRHGDLKALSNVYGYKEIFDFEDYFTAAVSMSHALKMSPKQIFVSTDSVDADRLHILYNRFMTERKRKAGVTVKPKTSTRSMAKPMGKQKVQSATKRSSIKVVRGDGVLKEAEDDDLELDSDGYDEDYGDYDDDDDDDDDYDEEDEYYDDDAADSIAIPAPKTKSEYIWHSQAEPKVFAFANSDRYRTEHGSHTVAANGGCQRDEKYNEKGMRCALNYQAIVHYQTMHEHRSVPRAMRLMRVMLEAIEDIFHLSHCSALVAQGSSHFSTLASLLIWARTGAKFMEKSIIFLDRNKIEQGLVPTAFLHGMNLLNGTHSIDESTTSGAQRWSVHTNYFISGLANQHTNNIKIGYNPWGQENRMKLVQSLPRLPEKLFYNEARTWLGGKYKPVWPGMCPGDFGNYHTKGWSAVEYITITINLGVEHLSHSHEGQALQCWKDAISVIDAYPNADDPSRLQEYRSVAVDNSGTMKKLKYAEMIINENHSTREFLDYQERYMRRSALDEINKGNGGMKSLEDVNEEIATLEGQLEKLKTLRDKLISANYVMLSGGIDSTRSNGDSVRVRA